MTRILSIQGGNTEVTSPGFRVRPRTVLQFSPGGVEVTGADFSLRAARRLSFRPAGITVSGQPFTIRSLNPRTTFIPSEARVEAPGLRLVPRVRIAFPALRPTRREFTPAEIPVTKGTAANGASSRRLWASVGASAKLKLTFENIEDFEAESIIKAFDAAQGPTTPLAVPPEVVAGVDELLAEAMRTPSPDLEWFFTDPPSVTSVQIGVSTVNVTLEAKRLPVFRETPEPVYGDCVEVQKDDGLTVCDVTAEFDCEPIITNENRNHTWVALHSQRANDLDITNPLRPVNENSGSSESAGCCFDKEGNVYGAAGGYHDFSYSDITKTYLGFCKISNDGSQLWEITFYFNLTGDNDEYDTVYGGGLKDFDERFVIGAACFKTTQYIYLIPKDGDASKVKVYTAANIVNGCIDVLIPGRSIILGSSTSLYALQLDSAGNLTREWAVQYSLPSGAVRNNGAVYVNKATRDIIVGQYGRAICFTSTGTFKFSKTVFFDAAAQNMNVQSWTSDQYGNWYTGYTTRVQISSIAFNDQLMPWIAKLDSDGNLIRCVGYEEGPRDGYVFMYHLVATDDDRVIIAGEGGIVGAFTMKVAIFSSDLIHQQNFCGLGSEFDDLNLITFSDNYAAPTNIDWCGATKELLYGNYTGKGYFSRTGYASVHSGLWKIRIDEDFLGAYFHEKAFPETTITILPRNAYALDLPITTSDTDSNSQALVPTFEVDGDGLDASSVRISGSAVHVSVFGTWNGPVAEIYKIPKDQRAWFWYPRTISAPVYFYSDDVPPTITNIAPSTNPVTIVTGDAAFPEVFFNPEPSATATSPVAAVFKGQGFITRIPSNGEVWVQLAIEKEEFNFIEERTGVKFEGDTNRVLVTRDPRKARWALTGAVSAASSKFDMRDLPEYTIEVDVLLKSEYFDLNYDAIHTILAIGQYSLNVYFQRITNPTPNQSLKCSMEYAGNLEYSWVGSGSYCPIAPDRWTRLSVSVFGGHAKFRMSSHPTEYVITAFGWEGAEWNAYEFGLSPYGDATLPAPDETYITLGSEHDGSRALGPVGYIANLRVSTKSLYNNLPKLPILSPFPAINPDAPIKNLDPRRVEVEPPPTPNASDIISLLLFEGGDGSAIINDAGSASWVSAGGVITTSDSLFGASCLSTINGGVYTTNCPGLVSGPFFFDIFFRFEPTLGALTGYSIVLCSLQFGAKRLRITMYARSTTAGGLWEVILELSPLATSETGNSISKTLFTILGAETSKYHLALVVEEDRSFRVYLNGRFVLEETLLSHVKPRTFNDWTFGHSLQISLGATLDPTYAFVSRFPGYIFGFRLGKGALYTNSFTPITNLFSSAPSYTLPPSPEVLNPSFKASDVISLVNFTGSAGSNVIVDSIPSINKWGCIGLTAISDTVTIGGLNTVAHTPTTRGGLASPILNISDHDPLTVEFYAHIRPSSSGVRQLLSFTPTAGIRIDSNNEIYLFSEDDGVSTPPVSFGSSVTRHIAFVKSSNKSVSLFVSGVLASTASFRLTVFSDQPVYFLRRGASPFGSLFLCRDVHIGSIRISKFALYTSNFTPPTAPLTLPPP
jgi:hypothetical protein